MVRQRGGGREGGGREGGREGGRGMVEAESALLFRRCLLFQGPAGMGG